MTYPAACEAMLSGHVGLAKLSDYCYPNAA